MISPDRLRYAMNTNVGIKELTTFLAPAVSVIRIDGNLEKRSIATKI